MRSRWTGIVISGLSYCVASAVWAGPDWVEDDHGDAGSLPGDSQSTEGDQLSRITGRLGSVTPTGGPTGLGPVEDFEDMYLIFIENPSLFSATTIACTSACDPGCGGCAEFDTQLWLFDVNGLGLLGNQSFFEIGLGLPGPQGDSLLDSTACDAQGQTITTPGLYLIAITYQNQPASADGSIFDFDASGSKCPFGEQSSADGPGAALPITNWFNNFDDDTEGVGAEYTIFFQGVRPAISAVQMSMDIKPGGCPNPFNRNSNGVLPVSLCGTADLDIGNVILSSVRMSRPDGMGGSIGSVAPHEGPPGPHSTYGDEATPYTGPEGGCSEDDGDGIEDLNMKFKTQELVSGLQMDSLLPGALVEMNLKGQLTSGSDFFAKDYVRLVPPGTPPGMLSVLSTMGLSWVTTTPLDLNLDGGGFGSFQRTFPQTTVVTLTAQEAPGMVFRGWRIGNQSALRVSNSIQVTISSANHQIHAVFERGTSATSISD